MNRRPYTITKMHQEPEGYWSANVVQGSTSIRVDNRCGSWLADVRSAPRARSFERREVLPHVAKALQAKLPQRQRRKVAA